MQKKLNEDFIDSYCEKFASKVTDSFFTGDKISITGKEILKVTPSKQTNLFVVKLIFQYWQGESKKLESPFFNYETDSVKEAMVEFMNVLSQNIEVHKNRFQLLLNHAVKDAIYLAASPQAFLEIDLDGADVDKIGDDFIAENVKYIKIHKKDIQNFLADMRGLSAEDAIDELSDEFEPFDSTTGLASEVKLLSDVLPIKPEQVLSESFPEDFDEYEEDETFDNDDPKEEVDNEALFQAAANDVKQPAEEESVQEEVGTGMKWGDENDELSIKNSESEIEHEPGAEQQMTEPFEQESFEVEDETPTPAAVEPGEEINEETTAEEKPATDQTETLSEETATEPTEESEVEEPAAEPETDQVEPEQEKSETETINDQFEKTEKTVVEDLEEKKTSSMMELISVNHQFMFVKELFKDDQVSFQNALYELEDYDTFDDAVEFLVQGYAKEFTWDMQSNEVKELLKVLFRKFRT